MTVTLVIPTAIVAGGGGVEVGWGLPDAAAVLPALAGAALIAAGVVLIARTVRLLATVGRGTLAPWDPTSRLVVRGPYRHVRNPMISGVLAVLLGEALLLGSPGLAIWFAAVLLLNALYLPLVEEPGLVRRFGEDYEQYRDAVPRWIPKRRAFDG